MQDPFAVPGHLQSYYHSNEKSKNGEVQNGLDGTNPQEKIVIVVALRNKLVAVPETLRRQAWHQREDGEHELPDTDDRNDESRAQLELLDGKNLPVEEYDAKSYTTDSQRIIRIESVQRLHRFQPLVFVEG